jgi:putative DNA primase/helicase
LSGWSNYDDVLQQFSAAGLVVEALEVGRMMRVPVTDDRGRQQSGWYTLHELRTDAGDLLLVGAFGNWRDGTGALKVEVRGRKLSTEEREAMRARIKADRAQAESRRKAQHEKAARKARATWEKLSPTGQCDYLERKGVQAHGVRFSSAGNLAIPMMDTAGRIHGLQVIYGSAEAKERKGRDKDFWPAGLAKRGTFFQIGAPSWVVLVCEGYATGASLHEATGYPVAVAWDAGNLLPVCEALRARYRQARILVCADDDFLGTCRACGKKTTVATAECDHCGEPHGKTNTGITAAANAAMAVDGRWIAPRFEQRGEQKLTDFNDLHLAEGLHVVRAQVEEFLDGAGWRAAGATPPRPGGGDDDALRPISSEDELLERFSLVYGHGGAVFDAQEHALVSLSDMRDACTHRELHRRWQENPARRIVRIRDVGFDPTGTDPEVKCNLWGGWPTKPRSGRCDVLLDLLDYLCNGEKNTPDLFDWVLKWLAYPIQHPGAKMKTALVLHGPQGAGKNMFFEAIMAIYGQYGRVIDQTAIEDKFNDWASKKLFLIADEVVARAELFHVKNKLKSLITGDWIRINPKNVAAYDERNHVNLVFLSNETQPLVLEPGDRRYAVIWTPPELPPEVYVDVKKEIADGGIEALHDHLLNLPLGDFAPHTRPPMTWSKEELIDLGLDSTERFFLAWTAGEIEGVDVLPALSTDLYKLYRGWCAAAGIRNPAPQHILLARLGKRQDCRKQVCRYFNGSGGQRQGTFLWPLDAPQEPPDGQMQTNWLSKCVDQFRLGSDEWRDNHNG